MTQLAARHRPVCGLSATLGSMNLTIDAAQIRALGGHREAAALARRYCDLIDLAATDRGDWLCEVALLLPRLHAAIASFAAETLPLVEAGPIDLDARFELFTRLRKQLDGIDSYWLEFDSVHEGVEAMTGSLADDLTDIYCELKHGLTVFDIDPADAMLAWSAGYDRHWGQHLIDAERHLVMLASQQRLGA